MKLFCHGVFYCEETEEKVGKVFMKVQYEYLEGKSKDLVKI